MHPAVHFFEEYPTRDNLAPASLLRFPATVFLAAQDWASFQEARELLREANPLLCSGWWPVLPRTLTLSALADAEDIDELTRILQEAPEPLRVLFDLELPLWDRARMVRWVQRSKARAASARAIDRLFATALARHATWTAEYPPALPGWLRRASRLELPAAQLRVYMLYSSILPGWWRRVLRRGVARRLADGPAAIGIGTLATGVAGNERILPPDRLANDLEEAEALGASAVVLYRLGGLTAVHAARLEKFATRTEEGPDA